MTDDPITAYGSAWLAVDEDERTALLEVAWAPDAVYCDPLDRLEGREALGRHIGATQAALAGGQIAVQQVKGADAARCTAGLWRCPGWSLR